VKRPAKNPTSGVRPVPGAKPRPIAHPFPADGYRIFVAGAVVSEFVVKRGRFLQVKP
jgi:hypothetical protein